MNRNTLNCSTLLSFIFSTSSLCARPIEHLDGSVASSRNDGTLLAERSLYAGKRIRGMFVNSPDGVKSDEVVVKFALDVGRL